MLLFFFLFFSEALSKHKKGKNKKQHKNNTQVESEYSQLHEKQNDKSQQDFLDSQQIANQINVSDEDIDAYPTYDESEETNKKEKEKEDFKINKLQTVKEKVIYDDYDDQEDEDEINMHEQVLELLAKQKQLSNELKKQENRSLFNQKESEIQKNEETNSLTKETNSNEKFTQSQSDNKKDNIHFKKHIDIPLENDTIIEISPENDDDEIEISKTAPTQPQSAVHEMPEAKRKEMEQLNKHHLGLDADDDDENYVVPIRKKKSKPTKPPKPPKIQLYEEEDDEQDYVSRRQKRTKKQKISDTSIQTPQIEEPELYESIDDNYDSRIHFFINGKEDFGTCYGQHTIRQRNGNCVCEEGYVYGDPLSEIGCWKCDMHCHKNATCRHSGHCECLPGTFGDGVTTCIPIYPIVKSISPISGSDIGGTLITILFDEQQKVEQPQIFCKFGKTVFEGQIFNKTHAACISPGGKPDSDVFFSVSFNGNEWSKTFIFHYNSKYKQMKSDIKKGIILIFISMFSAIIKNIFTKPKGEDEFRPFLYLEN